MATKKKPAQNSDVTNSFIGKLLPKGHGLERDAVHTAVLPVTAGVRLRPNEKIKLKPGTENIVVSAAHDGCFLGRVDPNLEIEVVNPGDEFLMWLRPGSADGLRHHWTHPDIND